MNSGKQKSFSDREDLGARLDEMNERLGRSTESSEHQPNHRAPKGNMGMGLRLASEFVSSILVGALIGYGIDWLAGTAPWAMIVFLMFGFASGVMNVIRSAQKMQGPLDPSVKDLPDDDDEDEKNW